MINGAREFAVRWLLIPAQKAKITVIINPRTEIQSIRYQSGKKYYYYSYVRIPFEDYNETETVKYTSHDTKYKIIDKDGNVYNNYTGEIVNGGNGIYSGQVYFNLAEGTYYYRELESGIGKNLIAEDIKIEVKSGMAKVINIDHTANEYRLYFTQECIFCNYDFVKDFDVRLSEEEEQNSYQNAVSIEREVSFDHCNYQNLKRCCIIKSFLHNNEPVNHKLTFINERIWPYWINKGRYNFSSEYYEYQCIAKTVSIKYTGVNNFIMLESYNRYEGLLSGWGDNVGYIIQGEYDHNDLLLDYSSGTRSDVDGALWDSYGVGMIEYHLKVSYSLFEETVIDEIEKKVLSDGKIELLPIKNGLISKYKTTQPIFRYKMGNDEGYTSGGNVTEENDRSTVMNTSRCSALLEQAIKSAGETPELGTPVLIFDTGKEHKFDVYKNASYGGSVNDLAYEYVDDSEITSMYFSAVNAINTIREE